MGVFVTAAILWVGIDGFPGDQSWAGLCGWIFVAMHLELSVIQGNRDSCGSGNYRGRKIETGQWEPPLLLQVLGDLYTLCRNSTSSPCTNIPLVLRSEMASPRSHSSEGSWDWKPDCVNVGPEPIQYQGFY